MHIHTHRMSIFVWIEIMKVKMKREEKKNVTELASIMEEMNIESKLIIPLH